MTSRYFCAGIALLAATSVIAADTVVRDVTFDLTTGLITDFDSHMTWEPADLLPMQGIEVNTTDTYEIRVRFADAKCLRISEPGTNPLFNGRENFVLELWPTVSSQHNGALATSYNFIGVEGSLLNNPLTYTGGSGPRPIHLWAWGNFTDSYFSFSGVDVQFKFSQFEFINGSSPTAYDQAIVYVGGEALEVIDCDPVRTATIDFDPNDNTNTINTSSKGKIWVAAVSASTFDAMQVDVATVTLGPASATAIRQTIEDVNGDGLLDLNMQFNIPAIGLTCQDTAVTLTGSFYGGIHFEGVDQITPVSCRPK